MFRIDCEYSIEPEYYTCTVENQHIPSDRELDLCGYHEYKPNSTRWQYDNSNVRALKIMNCNLTKIPQDLLKLFPRLQSLTVSNTTLANVSKDDFGENANRLKILNLSHNLISFLPGDLLDLCWDLRTVTFEGNILSVVEPKISFKLNRMDHVNLDGIAQKYGATPKQSLEVIQKKIFEVFFRNGNATAIRYIHHIHSTLKEASSTLYMIEHLKKEVDGLKKENEKLKKESDEIEPLKLEIEELKSENFKAKKSNQTDIRNFLANDEIFKDFKVLIEDNEFAVHKLLLAAKSPTLADMLKNNPDAESLNLDGISVGIFEKIVKFFYTDELPCDNDGNFLELFAVSGRLKVEELKNFAAQKVIEEISEENSLRILRLSMKYEHAEMRRKAFEEIKKMYPKIKFEFDWLDDAEKVWKLINYVEEIEKLEKKFAFTDISTTPEKSEIASSLPFTISTNVFQQLSEFSFKHS